MRGIIRRERRAARLARPGKGGQAPESVTGGQASPPAIAIMPTAEVLVYPASSQYVTLAYRGMAPMWAPDGETILARQPGRWAQLRAAGRS